jgi:hypothetical protein
MPPPAPGRLFVRRFAAAHEETSMHTKNQVLGWLEMHPQSIRGAAEDVVRECEDAVRRHAGAEAWRSARDYMSGRRDLWEKRRGYPITSSRFVARELCSVFAHELKSLHPTIPDGSEEDLAGSDVMSRLDAKAWREMRSWVHDLALDEERRVWKEVIRFTRSRAASLPEQRVGLESDWDDPNGTYGHAAAVIAAQLMAQYEEMARAVEH